MKFLATILALLTGYWGITVGANISPKRATTTLSKDSNPTLAADLDAAGYDIQNIGNASSSLFSSLQAFFGATATTTIGTDGTVNLGANIVAGDNSITGLDTITFTDTAGTIASIQNQNLLDKSATESITGNWDFALLMINTSTPYNSVGLQVDSAIITEEVPSSTAAVFSVDWSDGNQFELPLSQAGHTVNMVNQREGQAIRLVACQDGTGSRTITSWDSNILWSGGTAPTLTTDADACDIISCVYTTATSTPQTFCSSVLDF